MLAVPRVAVALIPDGVDDGRLRPVRDPREPVARLRPRHQNLTVISSNAGVDDFGIGILLGRADPEDDCHLRR